MIYAVRLRSMIPAAAAAATAVVLRPLSLGVGLSLVRSSPSLFSFASLPSFLCVFFLGFGFLPFFYWFFVRRRFCAHLLPRRFVCQFVLGLKFCLSSIGLFL